MADSKISALPASTTPLAGTEVLPIVQSSTTKQVSVANLTAGRAIAATSIQFGSGTVLSIYEQGTWTPGNSSMTVNSGSWAATGTYTRIGRTVFYSVVQTSGTVSALSGVGTINGFPFAPARGVSCTYTNSAGTLSGVGLLETNSVFYAADAFASQTGLRFSGSYEV